MSARDFLRRQLTAADKAKLIALPSNAALLTALGQKQAVDASLTTLSGKTIGAKGLDLLACSTSAAAINALGGSGGQIVSAMVESLDAAKLTGTIDVARLPVIPGNNSIAATTIAGLTTLQQATVSLGTMVYTADGGAWRYSGTGSKIAEASYYYTADVTPEWTSIANKPPLATAAQGALADTALQSGAAMTTISGLVAALGNRLRLDAAQTLDAGQKAQGQTNLGVDQATLDARYRTNLEVSGYVNAYLGAPGINGYATVNAGDASQTGFIQFRQKDGSRAGFIGYANSADKRIALYAEAGYSWEIFGTMLLNQRAYYGAVNDAGRLITYGEAVGLVGGGGGGGGTITSVFGRPGPLIDAASGDYSSSQISHPGGNVASALSSIAGTLSRIEDTLSVDLNGIIHSGWYIAGSSTSNRPGASIYRVEHIGDNTYATQMAIDIGGASLKWFRRRDNTVWGSWEAVRWTQSEQDARYAQEFDVLNGGSF